MGFFSWVTSDTNRSISNIYSCKSTFPVWLLHPDGTKVLEPHYEGYGDFGERDVYALLAEWNKPEECFDENGEEFSDDEIRLIGINLQFGDPADLKYPLKFVEDGNLEYDEVEGSRTCPWQGYFYDSDDEEFNILRSLGGE